MCVSCKVGVTTAGIPASLAGGVYIMFVCGCFADYVYNPKEARIRKAMRDANRERSMGVAPATRAARRTQPWVLPEQDDQFMMVRYMYLDVSITR